jgi:hypothetical protein
VCLRNQNKRQIFQLLSHPHTCTNKHSLHESTNENGLRLATLPQANGDQKYVLHAQTNPNLDKKYKKQEETIQRVATNTIGYTRKQTNKEWFDEECAKVNEEKNTARERAIQNNTRGAKNTYKLSWTKEQRLFRKRARQLDEESFIEIE